LEQLLAFAPERITVADVHGMLGTAGDDRLEQLVEHLAGRDAAGALAELETCLGRGVDVGLLVEQLFGYLRDCLAAAVGCPAEMYLYASPGSQEKITALGQQFGVQTLLAIMQILDQTLYRLRQSTQARVLAELALVRVCSLEDLDSLPAMIAELRAGGGCSAPGATPPGATGSASASPASPPRAATPTAPARGPVPSGPPPGRPANTTPAPSVAPPPQSTAPPALEFKPENATELWSRVVAQMSGMVVDHAKHFDRVAISAPNRLVVSFKAGYTFSKSVCERPDQVTRFQQLLCELTGQPIAVEFEVVGGDEPANPSGRPRVVTPQQRLMEVAEHPMVRRAGELFGAEPTRVTDPPKDSGPGGK
ncbi:MAG: hypothetical protein JW818_05445, partial [Pirellulales bacterium]|nr:hypothetical protein [Pirellulales bacterium]